MRLPDVLGVVAALVVGGLLAVILLASALGAPPALPSPVPPSIPPLPTASVEQPSFVPTTEPGETAGPIVTIGQPAPPLQVTLTDGSLLDLADYSGQPLWVNFMTTWSPQSTDELPLMKRYQKDFEGHLTIFVVDVGEDRQTVNQFMKSLNFDLPVGVDKDGAAQAAWGTYAVPVHVFIDKDGVVRDIVYGGAPVARWDEAIALAVPDFAGPSGAPVPPQ